MTYTATGSASDTVTPQDQAQAVGQTAGVSLPVVTATGRGIIASMPVVLQRATAAVLLVVLFK